MAESQFQFLGYRITNLSFAVEDSYGSTPEQLTQNINVESKFDIAQRRVVEVLLEVNLTTVSKTLTGVVKIKGLFKGSDDMDDVLFRRLSTQNAPAILYPLARAIVASSTAQAGIPALVLPVTNFVTDTKPSEVARAAPKTGG